MYFTWKSYLKRGEKLPPAENQRWWATNHPGLPRTVLVLALKVQHLRNSLSPGWTGTDGHPVRSSLNLVCSFRLLGSLQPLGDAGAFGGWRGFIERLTDRALHGKY